MKPTYILVQVYDKRLAKFCLLNEQNHQDIIKNASLRLRNLVMYYDVFLVRHQHLYVARYIFNGLSCDVVKTSRIVAKEDHPFENGYDKSTLYYEKELRIKRVVAKVR